MKDVRENNEFKYVNINIRCSQSKNSLNQKLDVDNSLKRCSVMFYARCPYAESDELFFDPLNWEVIYEPPQCHVRLSAPDQFGTLRVKVE